MRFEKFLRLFVIFAILLCLSSSFVFAEGSVPLTVKLSDATCRKDETAIIDFSLQDVPAQGINSFIIGILYDTSKLELIGLVGGPIIYAAKTDISYNIMSDGAKLMYSDYAETGSSNIKNDGVVCRLKFKALVENETVPVSLQYTNKFYSSHTEWFHPFDNAILKNGSIKILPSSQLYGDANNDNVIDSADYLLLRNYLLGNYYFANIYEDLFIKQMDLNGDSLVDTADYSLTRKYLLGIIKEFPVGIELSTQTIKNYTDEYSGTIVWVNESKKILGIKTDTGNSILLTYKNAELSKYIGCNITIKGEKSPRPSLPEYPGWLAFFNYESRVFPK